MSVPGRVSIAPRAIKAVVEATTADTFGVDAGDVRAKVLERDGGLDLEISTPARIPGPLLTAAAHARDAAATRTTEITGATFGHVRVRIADVHHHQPRRAR